MARQRVGSGLLAGYHYYESIVSSGAIGVGRIDRRNAALVSELQLRPVLPDRPAEYVSDSQVRNHLQTHERLREAHKLVWEARREWWMPSPGSK